MYIANGRVGNEKNIGKVTSKESSTGDYFIVVSELFPFITFFILLILTRYFLMFIVAYKCQFHVQSLHNIHKKNTPIKLLNWFGGLIIKKTRASVVSLTFHSASIHVDVSYQVSVHIAKQFQRRRFFRNRPIRNKNCM